MSEREPTAGDDQLPVGGAATTGPRNLPSSTGDPAAGPSSDSASHAPKYCPQCGNEYDPGLSFCPKDGNVLQVRHGENSLVGQILGRHYRILELLGEGGMGQVFLAEHVRIGRRCAIKVMRPALVRDPGAVGRFGREAMTAGRINHRNAVAVYDFGETDDGLIYIVMEHVEGEALSRLLAREGALAPLPAVRITVQITDALVAAHRLGIIHRDLKPDNILVGHDDDGAELVKVVDFGIAKAVNDDSQTALTKTGFVLGTLQYMSPEQLIGETLDGRSDIYSLGCILFEMLTGERTFAGPSGPAVVVRRLTEPAPTARSRNPSVPEALDAVVAKALARTAAERFQTAEEFRAALLHALGLDSAAATAMRGAATNPAAVQPPSAATGSGEQPGAGAGNLSARAAAGAADGQSTTHRGVESGPIAPPHPAAIGASSALAATPPAPAGAAAPEKPESGETSGARPAGAAGPEVAPASAARLDPRTGAIHSVTTPAQTVARPPDTDRADESAGALVQSAPETPTGPIERRTAPPPEEARVASPVAPGRRTARTVVLAAVGVVVVAGAYAVIHAIRRPATSPDPAASTRDAVAGAPAGAAAPANVGVGTGVAPAAAVSTTGAGASTTVGQDKPATPAPAPAATAHPAEPAATARLATMRVAGTLPAGAAVLLDGRPAGGSTFTAPPGRHTVAVVASGFEASSWTGTLAAGQTHVWRVSMRRLQNTAPASAPAGTAVAATGPASTAPAPPPVVSPPAALPAPATTQPTAAPTTTAPAENGEALRAAASVQARRAAEGLAAAITARDMAALRRAWPGIPPEPARRWREFLLSPDNRDIVAKLIVVRPAVVDGSAASAQFSVGVDFNNRLSGRATAVSRFTVSLARQGGDWTLTDIRSGW